MRENNANICVGNRVSSSDVALKSVPKQCCIHVYRLDPKTTDSAVMEYVKEVIKVTPIKCDKLQSKNEAVYSSFKLTINRSDADAVLDPKQWMEGVHVRRFFQRRETMGLENKSMPQS